MCQALASFSTVFFAYHVWEIVYIQNCDATLTGVLSELNGLERKGVEWD